MESDYSILGIDSTKTDNEVKRAYRKLSMRYHPDKNDDPSAGGMFAKISNAYLAIVEAREKKNLTAPPISSDFDRDSSKNNKSSSDKLVMKSISPINKTVYVSLVEAYNGTQVPVSIERETLVNMEETGNVIVNRESVTLYLDIPPGIDNNELITISNEGHSDSNRNRGDIVVRINVTNNTSFIREGLLLRIKQDISLKEALIGCNLKFEHLNGKNINIKSSTVIFPMMEKRIPGMGMKRGERTGDLILTFNVVFPLELTNEQIEAINTLF